MEKAIYGCDMDQFMESIKKSNTDFLMAAMSVLSDAQELLEQGLIEDSYKHINRAKYLISETRVKIGRETLGKLL